MLPMALGSQRGLVDGVEVDRLWPELDAVKYGSGLPEGPRRWGRGGPLVA